MQESCGMLHVGRMSENKEKHKKLRRSRYIIHIGGEFATIISHFNPQKAMFSTLHLVC